MCIQCVQYDGSVDDLTAYVHVLVCLGAMSTCLNCLRCFDTVGWVAGRESGVYKNLSGEVLAW